AGKTTLLRLLLGQLTPQSGGVRLGTNLQIAYFDQLRERLDEERTVQENVGDGYDTIEAGGKRQHIVGYLQNFLFSAERARTLVRFLSGGERNRVLLAKLFAKPANVIVLDEPTNDLDIETLELLESRLVEFGGTVLLVSHDREFLNNVVSSTIVFEEGEVREYVGGHDDWLRQRAERSSQSPGPVKASNGRRATRQATATTAPGPVDSKEPIGKRRLKYAERIELAELPEQIERLDKQIAELHQAMADPAFYQQPGEAIAREQTRLKEIESRLATAYRRWEELEGLVD
ncbi:MAG: ATP-binding cassette domain-containing protein, partial [Pirellulaceae bacterium]|nr:ATP-binding cassette domain-containing protein [Pirellulaceae bacterium]